MKNQRINLGGKTICFFLSVALLASCQKDVSENENPTQTTPAVEEGLAPDTPTDIVEDNSGTYTTFTENRIVDPIANSSEARTRYNLKFEYTTESSSALSQILNSLTNWNSFAKCCSYSIGRSTSYARTGSYSTRYELRKSDADVAGSKRTEANRSTSDESSVNVERWYGISYFLPSAYVTDPAPEIVTQWQSPKGVQPPLAVWTYNGNWLIARSSGSTSITTTTTSLGAYTKNAWTDFVFHIIWSTSSSGLIEVWKGGTKVYSKTGANTYSGQSKGNYLKNGIYKWPWKTGSYNSVTTSRVLYIDDVRIGLAGATYTDVSPGG